MEIYRAKHPIWPGFERPELSPITMSVSEMEETAIMLSRMANRSCGDCQECCKIMGVAELGKPLNKACPHQAKDVGCTIYQVRPPTCKVWTCGWQLGVLPLSMKPSKCGFVVNIGHGEGITESGKKVGVSGITIKIDPDRPDMWQSQEYREEFKKLSTKAMVVVANGNRVKAVYCYGEGVDLTEAQQDELDAEGHLLVMPGVIVSNDPVRNW